MNEMLVSFVHGLHTIRFFDLIVLLCVIYLVKYIADMVREELQHRRTKMYAELKIDNSGIELLDNIINEVLNEYIIFNITAKELTYIKSKDEEKIINYMQTEVANRIPTVLYKKLEITINSEYIGQYIGKKIYMTVTNYVLEFNTNPDMTNVINKK